MNKFSKSTKLLSLLLNIFCWTGLVFGLFMGAVTAVGCFSQLSSGTLVETFVSGITLDNIELYSSTGGITVETAALRNMQLVSLFVYFVQIPLTAYGIQLLRKILQPIISCRPFTGTGCLLRKLGWVSLILAAVQNAADWLMLFIMEHQYHFDDFFLGSIITDVTFHFQPDFTFVIVAIVVFILSGVFRYGEELQQLSDETL